MRARSGLIMMGATLVTACQDSVAPTPVPPPPVVPLYYMKARTNNGDHQIDTVYATLRPFRVLVRRGDTPAPGVAVRWEMGGDTTYGIPYVSDTTLTDTAGIASYTFTFGRWPGGYAVRASVPGVVRPGPISIGTETPCGVALCFDATATPATPTQIYTSGDGQTRPINTPLAADYVVGLKDNYGNAVRGVRIDWAVTAGGGSITPSQSFTESYTGMARARATLGPSVGPQTVTATVNGRPGVAPVTFTATAFDPGPVAEVDGLWDWTEEYTSPVCADTGTYAFTQTGSAFSGSSQQVGICYNIYTGTPIPNTTGPDPASDGFVVGDSITFIVEGRCFYYAHVFGNPPDSVSGTTACRNNNGTYSNGIWRAVREKAVASVAVTPGGPTLTVGSSLQLEAQLADIGGHRLFFRAITWSSDNPAVVSVSSAGVVSAVSVGSAIITASAGGQSGTATVLVP